MLHIINWFVLIMGFLNTIQNRKKNIILGCFKPNNIRKTSTEYRSKFFLSNDTRAFRSLSFDLISMLNILILPVLAYARMNTILKNNNLYIIKQ